MRLLRSVLIAMLCAATLASLQLQAQTLLYGLTTTNSLVILNDTDATFTSGPAITGLGAGETAVALDFRPFTGALYVLSRDGGNAGKLYTVDTATGTAIAVTLSGPTLALTGSVDIDFNPAAVSGANALRILTGGGQNYRLVFSATGATVNVDGAINVPGGAAGTNIIATAYTRNIAGQPGGGGLGGTTQYAIDSAADVLYRVNPPNDGTMIEAKPLGIDIDGMGGLDIVTGTDRVLGLFSVGGNHGLYEVNLITGAAMLKHAVPNDVVNIAAVLPIAFPPTLVYGVTLTNSLVSFQTDSTNVAYGPAISGLGTGEAIAGIDFRPLNGTLYALTHATDNSGKLYTIDIANGAATAVALTGPAIVLSESADIDFNPAAVSGANALRILTSAGNNYRLVFSEAGATVNVDGVVNIAGGASGANIIATAYTRNVAGLPGGGGVGGTTQYALDSAADVLYRVNPPNNGTMIEPKSLGYDIGGSGGLDIITGSDRALAVLSVESMTGLFEINLTTGTAQLVRGLPSGIADLAVPTPVKLGGVAQVEGGANLTWSGGVGPFAVQRAEVVNDPFCNIATVSTRTVSIKNEGHQGFYTITDLAAIPSVRLTASLSGAAERPDPVTTSAEGFGTFEINGNTLTFDIGYQGLTGAAIAAHIHGPADSENFTGVLINLAPFNGGAFGIAGKFTGSVGLTVEQKAAILNGKAYVNIHTDMHGGGEIRGQITPAALQVALSGAAERPTPVATAASGFGSFTLIGKELAFHITYQGLSGIALAAHIHGPAPSDDTEGVLIDLEPFNSGSFNTSGTLSGRVTLTPAQIAAIVDGNTYVNIHTLANGTGEIRGQIRPVIVGQPFAAELNGASERPNPVTTLGNGFAQASLVGDTLSFRISYRGLTGPATAAHIHGPAAAAGAAGVLIDLAPYHVGTFGMEGLFSGSVTLAPQQKAALLAGDLYVNVHTTLNGGGEIRGQLTSTVLQVTLNGASERPDPVTTDAMGRGFIGFIGSHLSVGVRYGGLTGPAIAAHIHGPATTEEANGVLLNLAPLAVGGLQAAGWFQGGFTLNNANVSSVADALTYVNIHTDTHGGGEIRGQVVR